VVACPVVKWRATADEDGHYSLAIPYDAEARDTATIGKSTMLCHLALRIVDPPMLRGATAYPSIAVISISLQIDAKGPMHKNATLRWLFRVYASPRSQSITVSGIPGAHCLRLWRALAESNDRNLSRHIVSRSNGHELFRLGTRWLQLGDL